MRRFEDIYPNHPRGILYLATCFRKHSRGDFIAYYEARAAQAMLWKAGVHAFSPIAAFYQTALWEEIDLFDNEFWMKINTPHMLKSHGLIILQHDNWEKSDGVRAEKKFFKERNSPIFSLDWPLGKLG